jgi:uncharacterized protein (TIGR03000 family)
MKFTRSWFALSLLAGALLSSPASAGWGLFGHGGGSSGGADYGSSGGAYGSSGGAAYGSSGGQAVGYGSSGGTNYAGYGSSGGYAVGYGSSGGAASYGSSGGAGSSGGSGGEPGFLHRALGRLHNLHDRVHSHFAAKHAARASNGSSGGYPGYGSSGGYSGMGSSGGSSGYTSVGYGSSGGAVSYGSSGAVSYGSTGSVGYGSAGSAAMYYGASKTPTTSGLSLVSNSTVENDSVEINVVVPAEAKVFVNGRATTSQGEVRNFVSRGLEAGKSYRFEIRAELKDGTSDTQAVVVTAGAQETVQFALAAPSNATESIDTAVTLNVPENAEVTLAGRPTSITGTSRTFRTTQLMPGQVWEDYVIRVQVGDEVKEQSIRLIAGDNLELNFDFAANSSRLASR